MPIFMFCAVQLKLSEAQVSVTGNLHAGANLGLVAEAEYSKTYTKNLVTFPIPVSTELQAD